MAQGKQSDKQRIKELEQKLKEKEDYINHLEMVSEAYSKLEALAREERIDADRTIQAQEIIQDLMREEKKMADQTIHAHEQVEDLAREEKRQAVETIRAMENVEQLAQREKYDAERLLQAQQQVASLSVDELMQRDTALHNVLEVNRYISSFLVEEILFNKILKTLVDTLHAQRGILYVDYEGKMHARLHQNIKPRDLEAEEFSRARKLIETTIETRKAQMEQNHTIKHKGKQINLSMISLPIVYEEGLMGLIYVDMLSNNTTFRKLDLDLAQIFSSQAAISMHNANLYEKIKQQNRELLKLNNLKNNFISHVSDELERPVRSLRELWDRLIADDELDEGERKRTLRTIRRSMDKIEAIVNKVITIISLEKEVEDLFEDKVDFEALIEESLHTHNPTISEKNLDVKVDLCKDFKAYPANKIIIKTILNEMISNALFYNKKNGSVNIKGRRKDDRLLLTIQDTGHGVRKKDQEGIFTQFYRTEDSPGLNEWGAGLGLYMVRNFLAYYDGNVELKSQYGKGSTFTLDFLVH